MGRKHKLRSHDEALAFGTKLLTVVRRAHPKEKLAVHFDIDSTLLNEDEKKQYKVGDDSYLSTNNKVVKLLLVAMRLGYRIVIITARPKQSEAWTKENLKLAHIPYDDLIFSIQKPRWKRDLSKRFGLRFVMSVGDSIVDVQGEYAGVGILLET